jgi:hypothetical protein
MLNTFKTQWDGIWATCDTLRSKSGQIKTGMTTKEDLPAALSTLKTSVSAYQQAAAAFNADETNVQLCNAVKSAMSALLSQQKTVQSAIAAQLEANKNAPSGALQMPDTTPAAKYNVVLEALGQDIADAVNAADLDFIKGGFAPDVDPPSPQPEPKPEPEDPTLSVSLSADVQAAKPSQPDWFKPDALKPFMAKG